MHSAAQRTWDLKRSSMVAAWLMKQSSGLAPGKWRSVASAHTVLLTSCGLKSEITWQEACRGEGVG